MIGDIITYSRSIADYPSMYAAIFSIIVLAVCFLNSPGTDRRAGSLEGMFVATLQTSERGRCGHHVPSDRGLGPEHLEELWRGGSPPGSDAGVSARAAYLPAGSVGMRQDYAPEDHRGAPGTDIAGEVEVNGTPVTGPGPDRAFVFQDFALLPWANVLRNVAFGLELRGVPRVRTRSDCGESTSSNVGLGRVRERAIRTNCPAACARRVGLARALAVDSEVLLMDEPFSAVGRTDPPQVPGRPARSRGAGENKTFLFVTHSIEEAVYVSDQVAILLPRPSRVSDIIRPKRSSLKGCSGYPPGSGVPGHR